MSDEEKVLSDLKGIVEYFMRLYREEEDHHIYDQHYDRMVVVSNACNLIEELLKRQEPRVLTLEEVKKLQSLRDGAVWLETWSGVVYPVLPEMSLQNVTYFVAIPFTTYRSWVENEYYGKTWRCWSSRPTDEQREAVPWTE